MSIGEASSQWSVRYSRSKMMFRGKIHTKNADILIDTGSFVTLINKRILEGLENVKYVQTSIRGIVGIENIAKPVRGAVLVEVKVGVRYMGPF